MTETAKTSQIKWPYNSTNIKMFTTLENVLICYVYNQVELLCSLRVK